MNQIKAAAIIALIALVGSLAYLYHRHVRKQEDAIAAFALKEISSRREKADCSKPSVYQEHCLTSTDELRNYMKTHTQAQTLSESVECIARNGDRSLDALFACYKQADEQEARELAMWAQKYPRQAAQWQSDILEKERKRDAADMNKRQ